MTPTPDENKKEIEKVQGSVKELRDRVEKMEIAQVRFIASVESLDSSIKRIEDSLNKGIDKFEKLFITKAEFKPVRLVTYGMVSAILLYFINQVAGHFIN